MRQSGSSQPSLGSFVVAVVVTPNCRSRFWSVKHSLLVGGSSPFIPRTPPIAGGHRRVHTDPDCGKRRPDAPKTARAAVDNAEVGGSIPPSPTKRRGQGPFLEPGAEHVSAEITVRSDLGPPDKAPVQMEACRRVGIGRKGGFQWRYDNGGMPPTRLAEGEHSGRYLSRFD